jgi:class 3 adenylate cyclase
MFHFRTPGPAVVAALEMVQSSSEAGLPPAHVGVHCGPVLFQEGDYFGMTVNAASRIADYARPGEVLVTRAVADATDANAVKFTEIGSVQLKGMSEDLYLLSASRSADDRASG